MFWREREMENKKHNGEALCNMVRVLVVGDSRCMNDSLTTLLLLLLLLVT